MAVLDLAFKEFHPAAGACRAGFLQACGRGFLARGPALAGMRRLALVCFVVAVACLGLVSVGRAQPVVTPEYRLKAVFLFHFLQFVEWPEQSFSSPSAPYVIAVLGRDPFGQALDETVRGEVIKGRRIEIHRFRTIQEVGACHVLYISSSEEAFLDSILKALERRPILTVSEPDGFTRRGGIVRFITEGGKVRLRINSEAAAQADLVISSRLLRIAEVVR